MGFTFFTVLLLIFGFFVHRSRIGNIHVDISGLKKRISYLESRLFELESLGQVNPEVAEDKKPEEITKKPEEAIKSAAFYRGTKYVEENSADNKNVVSHSYVPRTKGLDVDWGEKVKSGFEQNIATKLPVWIGAVSLIFAAFFLVKYSVELGWLSPTVRVSLGVVFGLSLLGFGQWLGKKENVANSLRMGQGLIGSGLVALYVSVYAIIHLYGLVSPTMGFVAMTGVTALAVLLSLRFGQPIAVFGLIGGLLTPALIGSEEPNALALFTYLFLLFTGVFVVLVRKGWWLLAIGALVGVFAWSAFWFLLVFSSEDALVLEVFAIAIAAMVLGVTGRHVMQGTIAEEDKWPMHGLNFLALVGGVLTIVWLGFETTITLFDWSMLGLLSTALIALACYQPAIYQRPLFVKLGASLCMFFLWAHHAPFADAVMVVIGLSAIYVVGSALIMRRVEDPRFWALLQVSTAIALYLISYFTLEIPVLFLGSFSMFWGTLTLILASFSVYQAYEIQQKYKADEAIKNRLLAIYTLAASAFIAIGFTIELPWAQAPLAIAGQIAATAWVFQKTKIPFLKIIMAILTVVFAVMNYDQILLFSGLIFSSLLGETLSSYSARHYMLDIPILSLGLPAVFIVFAFIKTWAMKPEDKKILHMLFGTAFILIVGLAYYIIKDLFHASVPVSLAVTTGFIERGIITILLAVTGIGIIAFIKRFDLPFLMIWGVGLFHLAMLRFAYFDLILLNPYWSYGQFVGNFPIFNGITLVYGAGMLLCMWALIQKDNYFDRVYKFYKYLGMAAFFALITFNVRQFYQGDDISEGTVSPVELYTYSVIWLLAGLSILAIGIRWDIKAARMASLAFVILAVLKVFLMDAAELEGLYRVFSFLGLGVSLIGLSYFYSKFVFANVKNNKSA